MHRLIRHSLSEVERESIARLCNDAVDADKAATDGEGQLLESAIALSKHLGPDLISLSQTICRLRDIESSPGLIVIENLPKVRDARFLNLLAGSILGRVVKEPNEGGYVIPIKEQQTKAGDRPSFKNAREFYFHTDLSYVEDPPIFLLMHSVANYADEGGYSLFCDIEDVISKLSALDITELQKPQFLFPSPPHYRNGQTVQFPILTQSGNSQSWRVRFRRDNLRANTRPGIEAIVQLVSAINDSSKEVLLETDSMVLIDNQSFLHGRTAFAGANQNAKEARHLNRSYATL